MCFVPYIEVILYGGKFRSFRNCRASLKIKTANC